MVNTKTQHSALVHRVTNPAKDIASLRGLSVLREGLLNLTYCTNTFSIALWSGTNHLPHQMVYTTLFIFFFFLTVLYEITFSFDWKPFFLHLYPSPQKPCMLHPNLQSLNTQCSSIQSSHLTQHSQLLWSSCSLTHHRTFPDQGSSISVYHWFSLTYPQHCGAHSLTQ